MCCAYSSHPVTGFMSDHPFRGMSDKGSSSLKRHREENIPVRSALPSKPPMEDIELAQQLIGHAKGTRRELEEPNQQNSGSHLSSPSNSPTPEAPSPSNSLERNQREQSQASQSYAPVTSTQSDPIPVGQVCR